MTQIIVPSQRIWTQQPSTALVNPEYGEESFVVQPGRFPVELISKRPVTQANVGKSTLTRSVAGLFNGSSAYQTFPRPSWIDATKPYFVIISFVPNNTTGARLLSFGDASTSFQLTASAGLLGWFSGNSGTDTPKVVSPAGTIVAGRKYTVVIAFNGSTYSMYINGEVNGGGTGLTNTSNTNLSTAINIGRRADGSSYFNGAIDLVAFVQKRINPSTARSLSENPWQIFKPLERQMFHSIGSGGISISAVLGSASASAFHANVDLQCTIAASIATASAAGFSATVNLQRNVSATLGNASAFGNLANVDLRRSIVASLGAAVASGYDASIELAGALNIPASFGVAEATGKQALVNLVYSLNASTGIASAIGFDASISNEEAPFTQAQLDYLLAYMQDNLMIPTAEEIAEAVLAAMQASPPPVNNVLINSATVIGDGSEANPWRGVGVQP